MLLTEPMATPCRTTPITAHMTIVGFTASILWEGVTHLVCMPMGRVIVLFWEDGMPTGKVCICRNNDHVAFAILEMMAL